ncbi:ABC transporter substrate-binding protein [Patescibacteria group bacterium]|nr:ABC transporter substrate-binding protein [Patescibacteria group bacterium]
MKNKIMIPILIMVIGLLILFSFLLYSFLQRREVTRINLFSSPLDIDTTIKQTKLFEERNPNIRINIITVPQDTDEQHDFFVKQLSSKSPTVDVFSGDVVWPAEFISNKWILPVTDYLSKEEQEKYLKGPMNSCRGDDGEIYCIPSFTDAGVLYYRKDLLEENGLNPPKTWDNLLKISSQLSSKYKDLKGFVFQADSYEGLICNFLEYVWGNNGSIQKEGKFVAVSPQNEEALQFMVDIIHEYKITPPEVTLFQEEESRKYFQDGKSVFLRNWPYVWGKIKGTELEGKVEVIPMVHNNNSESAATLGGWNIMINRFTDSPEASIKLAKFLGGWEAQKIKAINNGNLPTLKDLYGDEEVLKANPFFSVMYDVLIHAQSRPILKGYREVSTIFQKYIHQALTLKISPKIALEIIQKEIDIFQAKKQ